MTTTSTKRKTLTPEKMIAVEFRQYLKKGGSNRPLIARIAAFDRIADKHLMKATKK